MNLNSELRTLYLEKKLDESQKFLKLFYIAGPLLYLGFWLADILQYPEFKFEFLFIRLGFCASIFAAYVHNKFKKTYLNNQLWQLYLTIYGSVGITYMMMRTDGPSSIYYSGLNLVAMMSLMFATYQTRFFYMALALTYLPYYVLCAIQFDKFVSINQFIIHTIFISGTILAILFTRHKREESLIALLKSQLDLKNVILNREKVIEQKTDEATKLNQLSSQFSPQIVKAIKDGKINLDEDVHRSMICAIFIDIVRSTERVTSLPEENVQLVLAKFLDTVLTTFLKYDLTIDKFHGDGVLAFANNPVVREDFIERTCLAAIEAKQNIEADQEFYLDKWRSKMQVRIGISVGFANVGFYGGKKYFKSYTAIGAPLPYASRLTSAAEPDQILVDNEIANVLQNQNFLIKNLGQKTLKGFENDKSAVYELMSAPQSKSLMQNMKTCPNHPNSVLFLDTNENGLFVFKCRDCNYEDVNLDSPDALSNEVGVKKASAA